MPFTDRTPDAITTATKTGGSYITYRFDLDPFERTILSGLLENQSSKVGQWFNDVLTAQNSLGISVSLTVPNEA